VVTHRYERTHCLWLEQFQIADYFRYLRSDVMASRWLQVSLLCDGSCSGKRRNVAMWLLRWCSPLTSARPHLGARCLHMNGSSRLIVRPRQRGNRGDLHLA
jgi:hypothetical protein